MNKTIALVVATALVALTPMFAYADAGPKSQVTIDDAALLSKVDSMMGSAATTDNHGGFVSWANQNFDNLLSSLGLKSTPTRGQLISMIARSDAGKKDEGKSDSDTNAKSKATPNATASAAQENRGNGRGNSANHANKGGADDEATTNSAATATPTPTATTVAATVTTTATPEATATATATPEERGQGHKGGPNR